MKLEDNRRVNTAFVEALIRGMNHDMSAPARHIVHFSEMLSEQADGLMSDKHKRWLDMIHDSGKQLQEMLLSLTKLRQLSASSRESEQLDLRAVFEKKLDIHRDAMVADGTKHAMTIRGEWPMIVSHEELWSTLFSCLLDNAFKFQPNDAEHTIQVAAECECTDSVLTFILEDNGIGATEMQCEEITRPFKRLHRKDDYTGIGMGLAYCHFIAELNGATLSVDQSRLGGLRITYIQPDTEIIIPKIACL